MREREWDGSPVWRGGINEAVRGEGSEGWREDILP